MNLLIDFLVRLYPETFRAKFETELRQTTRDSLADRSHGNFRTLWDLAVGAVRENLVVAGWPLVLSTVTSFVGLIVVDLGASEVQAPVFVLMSICFLFGASFPRRAWAWALLIGSAIPLAELGADALSRGPLNGGSFIAFVPAFVAAYCGVAARRISITLTGAGLAGFCIFAGTVIGVLDFTLITPIPAQIGVGLCAWVVGRYSVRPLKAAIALGFGVPVGIVLLMAMGSKPIRRHYVFLDARAAVISVAAAAAAQASRRRFLAEAPNPVQ